MRVPIIAGAGPVLTSLCASVLVWALSTTAFAVPGRDGVVSVLFPLIPVAAGLHLAQRIGELVRWPLVRHARRPIGWWLAGMTVATVVPAACLVMLAPPGVGLIAVRNLTLATGLGVVVHYLAGDFASQATLFVLAAGCWLLGTNLAAPPDSWAVLLHAADRPVSWIVAAAAVLLAFVVTAASLRPGPHPLRSETS